MPNIQTSNKLVDRETQYILDLFYVSEEEQDVYAEEWMKFYKDYMLYDDNVKQGKVPPWRAKLFIPMVKGIIETIRPRMVNAVIGMNPITSILPQRDEDTEPAKVLEQVNEYQLRSRINFTHKIDTLVMNTLLYGNGIIQPYWRREFRKMRVWTEKPVFDPETGQQIDIEPVKEKQEVLVYDQPDFKVWDNFNVFPDPMAECIESAQYIITKQFVDYDYLVNLKKTKVDEEGKTRVKGIERVKGMSRDYDDKYKDLRRDVRGLSSEPDVHPAETDESEIQRKIELLEYWGKLPASFAGLGEGVIEGHAIIANRKALVLVEENEYDHQKKPFVKLDNYKIPHEFWSDGDVVFVHDHQAEGNTIRRQRLDVKDLIINPMYISNTSFKDKILRSYPGLVIPGRGQDVSKVFKKVEMGNINVSGYSEWQEILNDVNSATGIYDYTRGNPESNLNETASGIMTIVREANVRFSYKNNNMYDFIRELSWQQTQLNMQYIDDATVANVVGEERMIHWLALRNEYRNPETIINRFDFKPNASAFAGDKNYRINQLIQLYQLTIQHPLVNNAQFLRQIFELSELKDIDALMSGNPMFDPNMMMQILEKNRMDESADNQKIQQAIGQGIGTQAQANPATGPDTSAQPQVI